jgi:hypothetical protein
MKAFAGAHRLVDAQQAKTGVGTPLQHSPGGEFSFGAGRVQLNSRIHGNAAGRYRPQPQAPEWVQG